MISLRVYTAHTKTSFSSYQCDVMEQGFCDWNLSSKTLYSTHRHTLDATAPAATWPTPRPSLAGARRVSLSTSASGWHHLIKAQTLTQAPALRSSCVDFISTLGSCQTAAASKNRLSLRKDAVCARSTKTFMSCWERLLLLLFILPITSPPAAQRELPFDHQATHKHTQADTHT